jgi:hypothetical protein
VHLLKYIVECTVVHSPLNTKASCSKCPPSAWIHFVTRVTRDLVILRNIAVLLMFLVTGNSSVSLHYEYFLCVTCVHGIVRDTCDVMW